MKRWLTRLSILLVGLSAAVALSGTPALASAADCAPQNQNRVCVWTNSTSAGLPAYYWTIPVTTGGWCINFGSAINDKVRYLMIDTAGGLAGRSATMYSNSNCSGTPNAFVGNPPPDEISCWNSEWWPSCNAGTNQGSSIWVIRG